jgi:hypothetical protein
MASPSSFISLRGGWPYIRTIVDNRQYVFIASMIADNRAGFGYAGRTEMGE